MLVGEMETIGVEVAAQSRLSLLTAVLDFQFFDEGQFLIPRERQKKRPEPGLRHKVA